MSRLLTAPLSTGLVVKVCPRTRTKPIKPLVRAEGKQPPSRPKHPRIQQIDTQKEAQHLTDGGVQPETAQAMARNKYRTNEDINETRKLAEDGDDSILSTLLEAFRGLEAAVVDLRLEMVKGLATQQELATTASAALQKEITVGFAAQQVEMQAKQLATLMAMLAFAGTASAFLAWIKFMTDT